MFQLTNELLVSVLLFILTFSITFNIFNKLFRQKPVATIIGLSVSILVVNYISPSQLLTLANLYGATGIFVLIVLPYIIAFFFIYSSKIDGILRKIFWIFFGTIAIMLVQQNTSLSSELLTSFILLIALFIIINIAFDNWIKTKFNERKNLRN